MTILRRIALALREGGVDLGASRLPHGAMTGAGDGSGRLYYVFAPPLLRLDRWLWWLWKWLRKASSPARGRVVLSCGALRRDVRVIESGLALPNVPGAGATVLRDMTPEESRAMDELARSEIFAPVRRRGPGSIN